ncbi:PREDICTED: tigger transposable element-derived protein 2-like [Odobenus rosmarus divergens]|uniref:Tigger transposable element-derived protein 2-like n=1 Tax=Odobenus rosmarus divergens TaxID=9708 RepID=A0A9B0H4L0_ODORO
MPGKRSGDNEDPQKVKRPRGRPPGPKARLSAAARAAVVEAAAAWAAAEATPGGAEAMGILLPGQTRIKRRRRVMPLEDKMKILEKLEEGVSNTDVGRLFGVNESTVRTIKKNEKAIRASMESVSPVCSKVLCIPRDVNIEKMETELTFWVEDQTIGGRPLTLKAICSQAKRIYKQLVETTGNGNPDKFHASKGWFEKFRNRYSLRNSRLMGEEEPLNAQSAPKYSKQLQRLIRARGYVPQQVFNAEEMSLFWKCMPSPVTGSYVSSTYSIVFVNCPNEQIARDIARASLDKKLAASVNILPKASSLYFWNGEIEEATEILLVSEDGGVGALIGEE